MTRNKPSNNNREIRIASTDQKSNKDETETLSDCYPVQIVRREMRISLLFPDLQPWAELGREHTLSDDYTDAPACSDIEVKTYRHFGEWRPTFDS